jgi:hypothetical protein
VKGEVDERWEKHLHMQVVLGDPDDPSNELWLTKALLAWVDIFLPMTEEHVQSWSTQETDNTMELDTHIDAGQRQ